MRRSIERKVGSVLGRACFRGAHVAMEVQGTARRVGNWLHDAGLRFFRLGYPGPAFTVVDLGGAEEEVPDAR